MRTPLDVVQPEGGSSDQEKMGFVEQYYKLLPSGYYRISVYPQKKVAESVSMLSTNTFSAQSTNPRIPRPRFAPSTPSNILTYRTMRNHAFRVAWDPRSLNNFLELSDDKLSVKRTEHSQNHPFHKMRFGLLPQAVGYEYLSRQCYFEVRLSAYHGSTVTVAVACNNMRRNDSSEACRFGMNDRSWALACHRHQCLFAHDGRGVRIPAAGDLVGVFVDPQAGILSFYRQSSDELDTVCDLVHTVRTTFAKPLVAGIGLERVGSTAEFCQRMFGNGTTE